MSKVLEQQVSEVMIDIRDFGKYHKYELKPNDKIFAHAAKKCANARYEEFFEKALKPNATSDGKILCGLAECLWEVFVEKELTKKYFENCEKLGKRFDETAARFWIKEFDRPIEELFHYTSAVIGSAYNLVVEYHKDWLIREKHARIYSKGDDY